ncbi:hypothetical protein ACRHK7_02030 [Weissella tructae]|jgi:hypothetical protein|uniref:DUF4044 domain-containing protein n=1 Tax=Weissella tructae TaxID=887702 RepID=A0ABM5QUN9_9LACO|nr:MULTISPECIES: hypothetical protein [Weissella]AIG65948.1 hypothetical protein WS08_1009 [Weissella tructae]AIM64661.1 hypothetical protein WS105_1071 [Weissella ceti]QVV91103.1 hypothetical protein KHQ32_05645 [Weissella tructae]
MVENKQTQTDENSLENARYPFWVRAICIGMIAIILFGMMAGLLYVMM